MQNVSPQFREAADSSIRIVSAKAEVDWDRDGVYDNETPNLMVMETDRSVNEPLGGVQKGQFDLILNNEEGRYTPKGSSPIANLLIKNRPMKGHVGFNDELLQIAHGLVQVPKIDIGEGMVRLKAFDETLRIHEFKLPDGNALYADIRTDRYIWMILDQVYGDYFTTIASMDSDESWTNGTPDSTNARVGDGAIEISSTDATPTKAYVNVSVNASAYGAGDYYSMFLYVDDVDNLDSIIIRLHTVVDESWFEYEVTGLESGWNELWVPVEDFGNFIDTTGGAFTIETSEIGGGDVIGATAASMSSITRVEIEVTAIASETIQMIADELRVSNGQYYARRYFDVGLQTIPVAEFGGNTALYEIKSAAESEGSRFYSDEVGALRFENRQHYNVNDEHKTSSAEFSFDRVTDFVHPKNELDIINKVSIILEPRILQPLQVVWEYGATPYIASSETRTIYAMLNDPVPTTTDGLVTPVASTDYTANTSQDGTGTSKTAQIDVNVTRFTNSIKIDVVNNDGGGIYLTFLQLRGTPAVRSDPIRVASEDSTSIFEYGEIPVGGYQIRTKYIADESFAQILADQIIEWYKDPLDRVTLTARAKPELQLGDMISVTNDYADVTQLMRITRIGTEISESQGLNQTIECRTVSPFETLTYFEIGASSIESTDVLSP